MAEKTISKHAILSASGAGMWLNCPPSARLNEAFFKDEGSEYADEGTHAHQVAADIMEMWRSDILTDHAFYEIGECESGELEESVKMYSDYNIEKATPLLSDTAAVIGIEKRLDFSHYVTDGFGTCDFLAIGGNTLLIHDFKYGKGVKVSAERNAQLMLYALGAIQEYGDIFDIEKIHLAVIQPRLKNISEYMLTMRELMQWAFDIRDSMNRAYLGLGVPTPGNHCRFCRVQPRCKALQRELEQRMQTDRPELMTDAEVAETVLRAKELTGWVHKVEEYALSAAVKGKRWPGLKLVEGRGKREIADTEALKSELLNAGYKENKIMKAPELLGLTALNKLCGSKKFNELAGDYIDKAPGKPTLVSIDDPREEFNEDSMFDDDMLS